MDGSLVDIYPTLMTIYRNRCASWFLISLVVNVQIAVTYQHFGSMELYEGHGLTLVQIIPNLFGMHSMNIKSVGDTLFICLQFMSPFQ